MLMSIWNYREKITTNESRRRPIGQNYSCFIIWHQKKRFSQVYTNRRLNGETLSCINSQNEKPTFLWYNITWSREYLLFCSTWQRYCWSHRIRAWRPGSTTPTCHRVARDRPVARACKLPTKASAAAAAAVASVSSLPGVVFFRTCIKITSV